MKQTTRRERIVELLTRLAELDPDEADSFIAETAQRFNLTGKSSFLIFDLRESGINQ